MQINLPGNLIVEIRWQIICLIFILKWALMFLFLCKSSDDWVFIGAEWRIYASIKWPPLVKKMGWRQAIIWTNAGILLMGPSGTNFNEILIKVLTFSFKKMRLKVSSTKLRPFCLGLNVLKRLDYNAAVSKIRKKYLEVQYTSYFCALWSFQMFTGHLFQNNYIY